MWRDVRGRFRPFDPGMRIRGYNELARAADEYLPLSVSPWDDSYFQTYYSWPGLCECLPDLDGADFLAWCGHGDYAGFYHEWSATVIGLNVSRRQSRGPATVTRTASPRSGGLGWTPVQRRHA